METKFSHHGDAEDYPFKTVLPMELNHTKYQSGTLKWKKNIKKPNSREKNLKKNGYAAAAAAAAAKLLQLCLTLCDPIDSSPPGYMYVCN